MYPLYVDKFSKWANPHTVVENAVKFEIIFPIISPVKHNAFYLNIRHGSNVCFMRQLF